MSIMQDSIPFIGKTRQTPRVNYRRYQGPDDDQVIAEITQGYWDSLGLEYATTPDDIARSIKYKQNFNPLKNLVIAELGGRPVGFTQVNWIQESEGPRVYRHITRIIPEARDHEVDKDLLKFAEGRLRQLARRHPAHLPKYLTTGSSASDRTRIALLEVLKYRPERYFFEMVRPLDQPIPNYNLPPGIELRSVQSNQYHQILAAADEAFQDHWGHVPLTEADIQWFFESPQFQPHLWKVAWEVDNVVGMVLNYIDQEENQRFHRRRGYTEDICVRRPWRRRGIARALIAKSLQHLRQLGMQQAGLGVDTKNPNGALQLYQSVGYKTSRKHINYRKKIII
jgi:mycothiol synthase